MTESRSPDRPVVSGPQRCLGVAIDQMVIGTGVALVAGAATGAGAALYLLTRQYSELVFQAGAAALAAALHLVALGALAASAALLPLEILLAAGLCLSPKLPARVSPRRIYTTTYVVGLAAALGFLDAGFNRVRDLKSPLGIAVTASFLIVPILAIVALNLKRPRPSGRTGGTTRAAALRTLAAVTLVGAVCVATRPPANSAPPEEAPAQKAAPAATDPASGGASTPGPPVILISIDTLRADHLGIYGYPRPTTPSIDAFARDAVVFERAYSPTSWTLPSHASMLTGVYPARHGVRFTDNVRFLNSRSTDVLGDESVTLAEIFQFHGYATAGFTSSRWLSSAFGFDQGFDLLDSSRQENTAGPLIDKAIGWIDERDDEPFFLFLHFFDVHEYEAPDEYFRRFHPQAYSGQVVGQEWKTMGNLWQRLSAEDMAYIVGSYDAALNYVDVEIGRLLDHLRSRGRFEEALIVLTADHGEEFLDHSATGHGQTLYEEQVRVPLVLKPPYGEGAGSRIERPAALVDLVPTILDYAAASAPITPDGASLRPMILGDPAPTRRLHFGDVFTQNRAAVVEDDMKFITNRLPPLEPFLWQRLLTNLRAFYKAGGDELYDLSNDPGERSNLLTARPEVAARLRGLLLEHQRASRSGQAAIMDEETVEALRALGYLD